MALKKGLVQVYHGNGKGKTTAAFGLAFRAAGQGLRVCFIQFMKETSEPTGEANAVAKVGNIDLYKFGGSFIDSPRKTKEDIALRVSEGLALAEAAVAGGKYDLVILDEINVALHFGVAELNDVIGVIKAKGPQVELVLTGRYPPLEIINSADLVTEMREEKHPFKRGVKARRGIEW